MSDAGGRRVRDMLMCCREEERRSRDSLAHSSFFSLSLSPAGEEIWIERGQSERVRKGRGKRERAGRKASERDTG